MDKKILSEYVKEKVVTSPKKFGIEIEVEGCLNYKDDMLFWHVTEDASLRNNGKEFVSIPFLFPCLENVLGEIKPTLVKCVANARCGVHVHTSVEALTVEQYLKLLLYYMIYEPVIFSVAGQRDNNSFCVPLSGSEFQRQFGESFKSLEDYGDLNSLIHHSGQKYYALNVLPTINYNYCTVEFRHHKGTTDIEDITKFVQLLSNLLDIVYNDNNTVQELLTELCNINTVSNYEEVLIKLIKNTGYDVNPEGQELRAMIRKSVFNLRIAFNKLKL